MSSSLRVAVLASLVSVGALAAVVACSSSTSPAEVSLPDGGVTTATGGSCPCSVGNSGIHFTIGCGASQCIELNGQALGYRCETSGTVRDDSVCSDDGGSGDPSQPVSTLDAGPCGGSCVAPQTCGGGGVASFCGCTPQSCDALDLCGETTNDCNVAVSCPACGAGLYCTSDHHCRTPATAAIVYGNYQGGAFAINVDEHTPGLAIGLVSYQAMQVTIGGPYASDVIAVVHAGEQSGTVVTGLAATATFVDQHAPLASPDGGPADDIIDDIPPFKGIMSFPPSSTDIADYFQTYFDAPAVTFHRCQYDAYTGTLLVSEGGSCVPM